MFCYCGNIGCPNPSQIVRKLPDSIRGSHATKIPCIQPNCLAPLFPITWDFLSNPTMWGFNSYLEVSWLVTIVIIQTSTWLKVPSSGLRSSISLNEAYSSLKCCNANAPSSHLRRQRAIHKTCQIFRVSLVITKSRKCSSFFRGQ